MWDWYQLFNITDWLATGLISRNLSIFLEGRGQKSIIITQGNETAIQIDDVFLPFNFADQNPWVSGTYAVFVDESNNAWLGFQA